MFRSRIANSINTIRSSGRIRRPLAFERRRAAIRDARGYIRGDSATDRFAARKGDVLVTEDSKRFVAEIAFAVDGAESGAVVAGVAVGEEGDALGWSGDDLIR